MCSISCVAYAAKALSKGEVRGKKVIEIGACDINGSIKSVIEFLRPIEYIGVDVQKGPGVDIVCNAENLVEIFGKESFDVVVSIELLEHVRDWRKRAFYLITYAIWHRHKRENSKSLRLANKKGDEKVYAGSNKKSR